MCSFLFFVGNLEINLPNFVFGLLGLFSVVLLLAELLFKVFFHLNKMLYVKKNSLRYRDIITLKIQGVSM